MKGNLKFEVQGSKFKKPRTSDIEPLLVSPFLPVSLRYIPVGSSIDFGPNGG
jgi:hypothetical protein